MKHVIPWICLAGISCIAVGQIQAADWYPSKYGAGDTLGAINNLGNEKTLQATKLVKLGKTYSLAIPTGPKTPSSEPHRTYHVTVLPLNDGEGNGLGRNRATGNDDLLNILMGIGSQIDGLGHIGIEHVYYNGNRARDFVTPTGLEKLGIEKLPPIATRGVLLDMAKHFGKSVLHEGTAFNKKDIVAASKEQATDTEKQEV